MPVEDMGVNLVYETAGGTRFNIYETSYAGQAGHTIAESQAEQIFKQEEPQRCARKPKKFCLQPATPLCLGAEE